MLATQVLHDSDVEVNSDNDTEAQVVGFLTAENKEHVIRRGENKIGRDPSVCLIVLESFTVSKLHAIIESDGIDETFIYDVGSTNQTKLGKKNLKPHCRYKLDDNSIITFGNVVAEFKTQSNIECKKETLLEITPPYSGDQNKSNVYDDDIFELSTQVDFLQPSTSGEAKKFKRPFEDSHIFKIPTQRNVTAQLKTSPEPSQSCFDAETQCQIIEERVSPTESSSCDVPDSTIFNSSTQCQSPKSFSQKLSREEVLKDDKNKNDNEDLLNDGHDDILSAVSLHSPLNVPSKIDINAIEDCSKEEEKENKETENDEDNHNKNQSFNDSFLDITINDLEPADDINDKEKSSLNDCDKDKTEDNEETQQFDVETYKEILERKSLVVEESSDEETQIYSNEIDNEKSDAEDLITTQPYNTKNSESDKRSFRETDIFRKPSENDENEDFVCTQVFSDFTEKDKKKDYLCDNKKNAENTLQNDNDENEDFLATQLFSGPVNNFEKTSKTVEKELDGIEECEDFLATQMFSGPVHNFEKTKGKQKNSSMVEEIHESEDFLATQLFSQPVNNVENEEIKQNAAETGSSQSIENEESQDFLATQIFPESVDSGKKVPEKVFSNSETSNRENENFLETQLFPESVDSGEKLPEKTFPNSETPNRENENFLETQIFPDHNVENRNTVREEEDSEDFLATQIFEVPDRQRNLTREGSPDRLSTNDRQECSQDFIGTQLFPADISNIGTVVTDTEKSIDQQIQNIKQETSINFHISDSDNTESDLEVISDKMDLFPEKPVSPQSCTDRTPSREKSVDDVQSDNSNSSYVFEVENVQADSELNTTMSITETNKRESDLESGRGSPDAKKSKTKVNCLSVEMPNIQDKEKTLRKVNSECIQKSNYGDEKSKEVKINKRSRKGDCEGNEIPMKKSRISSRSCGNDEKRLSKLWQTHDIGDIRTSRTRQTVKTPQSKDSSEKSDRRIRSKPQEIQSVDNEFWSNSSKRSLSPQIESNFSSCRRVLRSSRALRYESPVVCEKYSTISSSHKNVPSRKVRKTSRRKSRKWNVSGSCVNIVFTGFECELLEKIIRELKGKKMEVLSVSHVLVTDKVRRTVKFLCAMGLGLPITSPEWLLASKTENEFLNPWNFILKDEDSEGKWEFDLKSSLQRSRRTKLMKGMSVFATKSTKPPPQELLAIVECCGGVPMTSHPEVWPKKTIIASCMEDEEYWPTVKPSHVQIVHYECILSGVLRQKLDIKRFKLN